MARSNYENPAVRLARRIAHFTEARNLALRGGLRGDFAPSEPEAPDVLQTRRGGDGSEANPYRTRHAMLWDLDAWDDAACFWADAPPEGTP